MSEDPLAALQAHAPLPDHFITAAEISEWEPGVAQTLLDAGFLTAAAPATHITCPSCEDHVDEVQSSAESTAFFIVCPESGIVNVPVELLRQWSVDHAAIARWIGGQLGARSEPNEPIAGRAWRWDRVHIGGTRRALIITRDVTPRGAGDSWRRLNLVPKAVVLSFGLKPSPPAEHGPVALCGPLLQFLDTEENKIVFLLDEFESAIAESEGARPRQRKATVTRSAPRERKIDIICRELSDHIIAAQDALRNGGELLPCPEQRYLAKQVKTSPATISRCIKDDTRAKRLWEIANDETAIRTFDRRQHQ